jgi:hypothetical protein
MKALIALALSGSMLAGVASAEPVIAAVAWQAGNSTATGDQDNAAIAANRSGHVAIVWEDDRDADAPENNVHSDIWIRLFKDGTSVYEKKLSAGGTGNWRHLNPDVGLDDKGNAVVVWQDDPDANSYHNIPVRVLGPTGTVLHSVNANSSATGQQLNPSVSVDPDGVPSSTSIVAYAVAWEDIQGTAASTVKVAAFRNATRTYEKTAHAAGGTNRRPDVAVSASGATVLVWDEDKDANGYYNVGLTRFSPTGTVTLAQTTANSIGGGQQQTAQVAATFNGEFAVAWQSINPTVSRVYARSFTPAGSARHTEVAVSALTPTVAQTVPAIGLDDQSNLVVTWTEAGADTWAHGFAANGTDTGRLALQQLSSVPAGRQEGIVVAVSPWGEVAAAYTDDNDGNLHDQIYLGFGITNNGW